MLFLVCWQFESLAENIYIASSVKLAHLRLMWLLKKIIDIKKWHIGVYFFKKKIYKFKKKKKKKKRRKHYFVPYILGMQSISFLNFCNCQFCPCNFQFTINLVPIINSLTKNAYTTDIKYNWHTWNWHDKYINILKF